MRMPRMKFSISTSRTHAVSQVRLDERGTATTEFVVCLPLFLIVFAGLLDLAALGQQSVVNKVEASRKMWKRTYRAERATSRMSPRSQLAGAVDDLMQSRGAAAARGLLDGTGGHWSESHVAARHTGRLYATSYTSERTPRARRLQQHGSPDPQTPELLGEARLTRQLVDDALTPGDLGSLKRAASGGGWGAVAFVSGALTQITGAVPGALAGIRYGDVEATHETSITIFTGRTFEFRARYSTAVSPSPVEHAELKQWTSGWVLGQSQCAYRRMTNMLAPSLSQCGAGGGKRVERYR